MKGMQLPQFVTAFKDGYRVSVEPAGAKWDKKRRNDAKVFEFDMTNSGMTVKEFLSMVSDLGVEED